MKKSIFEMIIDEKISSMKIYEDDYFIAFLDIQPKQKGHTLLVPKIKNKDILNESDFVKNNILSVAKNISFLLKDKLGASGIKMVFNSGTSAGQEVFHTHLHIIPYYDKKTIAINNEDVQKEILK